MTVQDILDELDTDLAAGEVEEEVKKRMPDYEVAAYDDDQDLGDSYTTTSIITQNVTYIYIQQSLILCIVLDKGCND